MVVKFDYVSLQFLLDIFGQGRLIVLIFLLYNWGFNLPEMKQVLISLDRWGMHCLYIFHFTYVKSKHGMKGSNWEMNFNGSLSHDFRLFSELSYESFCDFRRFRVHFLCAVCTFRDYLWSSVIVIPRRTNLRLSTLFRIAH